MVCIPTAKILLFVIFKKKKKKWVGKKKHTFNTLLFNWDSQESLNTFSKMLKSYQAAWAKSGNQLPCSAPVGPLLSGLHFLLLHCKCATACSHSTYTSADANWFLSLMGWSNLPSGNLFNHRLTPLFYFPFPDKPDKSAVFPTCV